jgi:hypothetical protein
MKLRIEDNTIRIRLSQPEILALMEKNSVKMTTPFPGSTLKTEVQLTEREEIECTYSNDRIGLLLPISFLSKWESDEKIGFETRLPLENGGELLILVEKDFKRLVNKKQIDESNLYRNPKRK